MVRLTGPMFSLTAAGKFGRAIVFAATRGVAYARMLVQPANPRSASQVSTRAMMRFLAQQWEPLTPTQKETWEAPAAIAGYSPFNSFVSRNMLRWNIYDTPSGEYPINPAGPLYDAPPTFVTVGQQELYLRIQRPFGDQPWGWLVHRSLTRGFTPSPSTVVVVLHPTVDPTLYTDRPLPAGVQQFYRIEGFKIDGTPGTLGLEIDGRPT